MDPLNESDREKAFPIHIELGRKASAMDMPMPGGKRGKSKMIYPMLYIDPTEGLEKLPKEGCMLVDFRRVRMAVEDGGDGDEKTGVTLEVRTICLAEGREGYEAESLDEALGDGKESDDEEDDE